MPPGGGPAPWQPYGPGPRPPRKSRAGLIIALATAGAVVVFGGLAVAIGLSAGKGERGATATASSAPSASTEATPSDTPHTIDVPASAGGYKRVTGSVADRLTKSMRKTLGTAGTAYANAKLGIYFKNADSQKSLIFIGMSGQDVPDLAEELRSRSPSEEVDSTFMGMGITDTSDFPAGPLGGTLRCGKRPAGEGAACAWADHSVLGMVMTPLSSDTVSLGATALALRNAAEH
jgi:hypothetical protein